MQMLLFKFDPSARESLLHLAGEVPFNPPVEPATASPENEPIAESREEEIERWDGLY